MVSEIDKHLKRADAPDSVQEHVDESLGKHYGRAQVTPSGIPNIDNMTDAEVAKELVISSDPLLRHVGERMERLL